LNLRSGVQKGFEHYTNGAWSEAKVSIEQTYTMLEDTEGRTVRDGPSKALLEFMAATNFLAPGDWNGFRELKDK
jgi:hypothetical protein